MTIFLDPGHGGADAGATDASGQLTENEINFDVAVQLAALLRKHNYEAMLSRGSVSATVPLWLRQNLIGSSNADLVVGIHHGASPASDQNGAQLLLPVSDQQGGPSLRFAELLAQEYEALGQSVRPLEFRYDSSGTGDEYAIVRAAAQAGIPVLISEYAYLDHPTDALRVATPEGRQQEAQAIFNAIERYFTP